MNELKTFNHEMFGELPVLIVEGVEWFGATEAAKALSFSNPYTAIHNHVDEDDLTDQEVIDKLGRKQFKKFTNESGLYDLILGASKQGNNPKIKAKAKKFKRWVTSVVLPTIRKTGGFVSDGREEDFIKQYFPSFSDDVKQMMVLDLQGQNKKLKQQIEHQKPLVTFAEACMQSDRSLKVGEVAKLAMKQGVKIGQKRLFEKLREWGLLFKNSTEPTQRACEREFFEVAQGVKKKPNGEAFTWTTTYVTPKGQAYIINRLKNESKVGENIG